MGGRFFVFFQAERGDGSRCSAVALRDEGGIAFAADRDEGGRITQGQTARPWRRAVAPGGEGATAVREGGPGSRGRGARVCNRTKAGGCTFGCKAGAGRGAFFFFYSIFIKKEEEEEGAAPAEPLQPRQCPSWEEALFIFTRITLYPPTGG